MNAMATLRRTYQTGAGGDDPGRREVARRQLARLVGTGHRRPGQRSPSRWAHVPLAALFEEAGNAIVERPNGTAECGHEPFHGSRSGRCVLLDPVAGRWWCRSCRRGGDAATLVMDHHGWSYRQAAAWLAGRYGGPTGQPAHPRRPRWVEA